MVRGIFILLLGTIAFAGLTSAESQASDRDGGVRGVISAIYADKAAFELTVRTDRGDKKILVQTGRRTEIYIDGHKARFSGLKVRMRAGVRGRFNNRGVLHARAVRARSNDRR